MSELKPIKMLVREDYEEEVKLKGIEIPCYSKKDLENMYPNDNWKVVGETKAKNKKKVRSELFLSDVIDINQLDVDDEGKEIPFKVSRAGTHSKLLYKRAGYVPVDLGEDNYIALLKFRAAFIFWLLALLGAIIGIGIALFILLKPQEEQLVFHPMPPADSSAIRDENDKEESRPLDEGGLMSMTYQLRAEISLSTNDIDMYFQNPSKSNHNVAIELYLVSGDNEIMIAKSGVIEPGYLLRHLTYEPGNVVLSEGVYEGKYLVRYFNPETAEQSFLESEIVNVKITVTQ